MPKESGIGDTIYVGQYDLSGDVAALASAHNGRNALEVPAINQTGMDRIMGLQDGEISVATWWNIAALGEHAALSPKAATDQTVTYCHGATAGSTAASMIGKQVTYNPTRNQDGSLATAVQFLSNAYPLEWGVQVTTGKQTFASSATTGTDVDDLGGSPTSTAFGAAAYLHVISIGSGTPTVAIQDAATLPTYANLTGMSFGVVTPGVYRLQGATNATVRRYLRVNVTGTFTNMVAVINVVRYLTDPSI